MVPARGQLPEGHTSMVSAETSPVPLSSQFPSPLSLYTLTLNELGLYTCILPPVLVIYNIGSNLH